jgi:hypothetical protein
MREVAIAQNQAFAEQRKDQGPPAANGYGAEPNGYQQDDTKQGGFAGADPKKRRGVSLRVRLCFRMRLINIPASRSTWPVS